MGRTIHYEVFGPLEAAPDVHKVNASVDLAQHMLNHHFSWPWEQLSLELLENPALTYRSRPPTPWAALLGSGFTKVYDDEWSAALVIAFLEWFSRLCPMVTVRVLDEGDFIRAGYVVIQNGQWALDGARIAEWRADLKSGKHERTLSRLDEAEKAATRGDFFADIKVAPYADHREIQKLCLGESELKQLTVRDLTARMTFPWQTEWLDRP
jgi:hypothetical protein